jgi:hypothetical protein
MLDVFTDNIFVLLGRRVFQQSTGIPKGINCASILSDLFIHVYEAFSLQGLLKNKNRKLVHTFISSFRCIDDVLSLNNSRFCDYLHRIYPNEIKITSGIDTQRYSYLDLHIEIHNGRRLKTKVYEKRNDFTFPIVNFPFIRSNIPASSAYLVYAPQLIRYSRNCAQNSDFLVRA